MSDFFDEMSAPAERPRKVRRTHRIRAFFLIAAVIAAIVALSVVFVPQFFASSDVVDDYVGSGTGEVSVVIPEGATGREIAAILVEADVIASKTPFIDAYTADKRAQSAIDPGSYKLKSHMSAAAALAALMDDTAKAEIKVTIPEGFTKNQVFERLANLLEVDLTQVTQAAGDTSAIGLPAEANGNPEGWFAPLTYTFQPGTKPADAMKAMVTARVSQLQQLGIAQDQWETLLTKASIIDREVNSEQYYPQVARVIENRLADTTEVNGRLQMDSTVLYGVGKTGGTPTQAELNDASNPYNTYRNSGLPPSPIGAASSAALKAALAPANGTWLYFVTVNLTSGETKFASTYAEHQTYVAELQAWIAANPQK